MRITYILIIVCFVTSCASSPGSPDIGTNGNDGIGYFIDGCQNISPTTPKLHYETNFYLSTWGSAWSEGAQSGLQEGLAIREKDRAKDRFTKRLASTVLARTMGYDGSLPPQALFCMHYEASADRVSSIVEEILPILQNPINKDILEEGVYKTEPYDRKHIAAKWRDQYAIIVEPAGENITEVTVYRDLWISRQGTSHVRATSNGGNEAWILQQISERL